MLDGRVTILRGNQAQSRRSSPGSFGMEVVLEVRLRPGKVGPSPTLWFHYDPVFSMLRPCKLAYSAGGPGPCSDMIGSGPAIELAGGFPPGGLLSTSSDGRCTTCGITARSVMHSMRLGLL